MGGLLEDPSFWVAVGTVLFLLLVIRMGVPGMVAKMLDDRAAQISAELNEAQRLRQEAEVLLAEYRKKTASASEEAQAILEAAKSSAERMASDARAQLEIQLERRAKMAEQKIAQAEAEAVAEVRAVATRVATAAASEMIAKSMTDAKGDALIDKAIKDLRAGGLH